MHPFCTHLLKKSVMESFIFLYSGIPLHHHYQLKGIFCMKTNHPKNTSKKPVAGPINRFLTQEQEISTKKSFIWLTFSNMKYVFFNLGESWIWP